MKLAIYIRTSTLDQHPENQKLVVTEWCNRNEHEIVSIFIDQISGYKASRPELDKMLIAMRNKEFDGIVVWKLDRLGRSLQHLLQVLQEMNNRKVKLISITEGFDTNTPQGIFFFNVVGAFAQLERDMTRERVMLNIERRKRNGEHLGRPFGSKDKKERRKSGYLLRWANHA